jgi:hypothetical protein
MVFIKKIILQTLKHTLRKLQKQVRYRHYLPAHCLKNSTTTNGKLK